MDLTTLRRDVDGAFRRTSAGLPPWPDPHPDRRPLDEEYSRCLDPGKYRLVAARTDAWVDALTGAGLATVEAAERGLAPWHPEHDVEYADLFWLRPTREQSQPVLVGYRVVDDVARAMVELAVGDPPTAVDGIPDCGCDACDSGSADLVELVDEWMAAAVCGDIIVIEAPAGRVVAQTDRMSAWGDFARGDIEVLIADARAGRSPHHVVAGLAWW